MAKYPHYGAEVGAARLKEAEAVDSRPPHGHLVGTNLACAQILEADAGDEAKAASHGILMPKAVLHQVKGGMLLPD
jgi:hypothetical protein